MTNDELLHKWINKSITVEELEIFKLRPEYDELVSLYQQTEGLTGPQFDVETMLDNIISISKSTTTTEHAKIVNQRTKPAVSKERRLSIPSWMKMGIAASLLLCAAYFSGIFTGDEMPSQELVVLTPSDGTLNALLPDKSSVVISPNSKLTYVKENWNRQVDLKGEAFFKVTKGSKFNVNTVNGVVSVIGTQFNVKSSTEILEVECKEGIVQVRGGKNYNELLKANDKMKLYANGKSITNLQNITKMQNVNLSDVLDALSSEYDREIIHEGINLDESVTCNFAHGDLSSALKTTVSLLDIKTKYETTGQGTIELSK